jgi:hypothetical protein
MSGRDHQAAFTALALRLAAKAEALAAARIARNTLERQGDPRRWRKANLIWPLFARR